MAVPFLCSSEAPAPSVSASLLPAAYSARRPLCRGQVDFFVFDLRGAAAWIPREHRRLSHIIEAEVQKHDPFKSNAGPAVGTHTVLKGIDVRTERLRVDAFLSKDLTKQSWIMAALRTRANFLTANEHVV